MTVVAGPPRCRGTTKQGRPCRARVGLGAMYCAHHLPSQGPPPRDEGQVPRGARPRTAWLFVGLGLVAAALSGAFSILAGLGFALLLFAIAAALGVTGAVTAGRAKRMRDAALSAMAAFCAYLLFVAALVLLAIASSSWV